MVKLAFFARFQAKPGKEEAVAKFLEKALDMVNKEPTTRMDARGTSMAPWGRR